MIRVGIIEDKIDNAITARAQIDRSGVAQTVGMWVSGESFHAWLSDGKWIPIDILLLDIRLSGDNQRKISGDEWIIVLRQYPKLGKTKIIAWTANVTSESIQSYKAVGFDGCIGKPYAPETFASIIQEIYEGKFVWIMGI